MAKTVHIRDVLPSMPPTFTLRELRAAVDGASSKPMGADRWASELMELIEKDVIEAITICSWNVPALWRVRR